ncbi:MAG: hypothetical protein C0184_13425, partial [Chloroflexus aggregans]
MTQSNQSPNQPPDLGTALRELGQQLETAFRAAIDNEHTRQVQQELVSGFRNLGEQVQSALKTIADDPRLQELAERGQQKLHELERSQAAQELQHALAQGIDQLNKQLAEFIRRMQPPAG